MATRTLTRLYDNHDDAVAIIQALEAAGFRHDDVSIVASNHGSRYAAPGTAGDLSRDTSTGLSRDTEQDAASGAGTGATVGTILGGGAGLLAGIGALAIPGVGPVVAAGWLVATLTGAGIGAAVGGGAGGLIGSLTNAGVSEEDAHVYAEGVRRGSSLVTARVDETRVAEAERIMDGRGSVDASRRRTEYQQTGWTKFDENAGPYQGTGTTTRTGL